MNWILSTPLPPFAGGVALLPLVAPRLVAEAFFAALASILLF